MIWDTHKMTKTTVTVTPGSLVCAHVHEVVRKGAAGGAEGGRVTQDIAVDKYVSLGYAMRCSLHHADEIKNGRLMD